MVVRRVLLTHRTPLGTRIFAVTTDPRTRPTRPSRYVAPPPPGAHRRRMNCDGMISRTSRGAGLLTEALHHPSEGPITIVSPRTQNAVSGRPEHLLRRMDRYDPGTTPTQRGWNNPRPIDIVVYSFAPGVPIRKFSRVLVEVNDMQRYVIRVTRCPGNGYAGRRRRDGGGGDSWEHYGSEASTHRGRSIQIVVPLMKTAGCRDASSLTRLKL